MAVKPAAALKISKQLDESEEYLKQKKVKQLIQTLASSVLFHEPENVKEFMIKLLEEMKTYKARGQSYPFFSKDDIIAHFKVLDVTGKGYITTQQYIEGLKTIGIPNVNVNPKGSLQNKISCEVYVADA
ncbi:EF-hand calcium-binding domain-containing protein 10 [Clydaea vesicula]|uniref:EF-hand calcium-binding domain-containing protein 10 n=1 Tax=Clydaea vesicula TaxID=447962 RepID=A0AAD5TXM2_9FUNG|nr:EF-hand calcium-binding domain-containing protein 10 [Clydaea vesicula]